jgi:penicillin-binding protein 1A
MTEEKWRSRLRLGPAGERVPTSRLGPERKHPRLPGRAWTRRIANWGLVAGIWAIIATAGVIGWYASDLPDVNAALAPSRRPAITIVAANGAEIATVGDFFGRPVTVSELPPALPRAVLAIEDRRFYSHFGLDVFGLGRAAMANIRAGSVVQGGSTITQQAAKNLFLTPERTIKRKIQELLLALWMERRFSKDQILAIYLNRAYFGAGTYGVDAAARKYFRRPATQLSTYQAALLAGLLKAPSRLNPIANPDAAQARTREVLLSMVDAGFISADAAAVAWQDRNRAVAVKRITPRARYFVDWIVAQLPEFVSDRDRDIIVVTTLDPRVQRMAEEGVTRALANPVARAAGVGQAALVALSPEGAVRALVGGRDYGDSPFNRATQAYRQPGSAFKPIVYAAGLEAGLSPETQMADAPITLAGWRPKNFNGRYQGLVSLRTALAQSINTVAVQVGQEAGLRRVVSVARRLGITADLDANASLALGTSSVSLLELTGAYAAFAGGGIGVWPYGIEEVRDVNGEVLYHRSGSGPGRVLAAQHAAAISDMLVSAVEWGTGRAARFGWPVAGKTGTSQDYRDAWFVGFSAEMITGVWMGNDDDRSMNEVTGGTLPARLWQAFMADAHAGHRQRGLPSLLPAPAPPPPEPAESVEPETAAREAQSAPKPNLLDRLWRVFGG